MTKDSIHISNESPIMGRGGGPCKSVKAFIEEIPDAKLEGLPFNRGNTLVRWQHESL
jgi:hypothetical protein